jgi:EAL domain-containing protein (putative c-di-GMP-specific phosphodiesterase class I)/PleD family two-component response regulator
MSEEPQDAMTPILFVDDEPEARRAFARAMSSRGFDVDLASCAKEALERASQRRYALVASDLNMPEMNGLRLIEQLWTREPETTYMIVTGVRELRLPHSPAAEHISSVVTKPWDADDLAQCIWNGVQLRRQRQSGWHEPATDPGAAALGDVLVLESDPFDPELMLRSLVAAGLPDYQVMRSERLSDALLVARDRQLMAIVTELSLPDARGLDAILALHEAAPSTPLVVIGRHPDEALALSALRAGAQDYLSRDQLTPEVLRRSMRFAIERQRTDESTPKSSRSVMPTDGQLFQEIVTSALSRAKRERGRVAVIYMNVARAHAEPDVAIRPLCGSQLARVMERVRTTLREYDTLAYLGQNRLGIILPAIQLGDRAGVPARRLLEQLSKPLSIRGVSVPLEVTLGISLYPDDADTAEELCRCADMAGYRAQAFGSGAYEFFDEQCQAVSRARHELETALDRALEQWQFVLQYRPQHAVASGRVVAAEVLVFWQRPDGQLWEHARFMGALEERDLSSRLTGWVLREACCQGRVWQAQHPGLVMALDLTASQLCDPDLIDKLQMALEQSGLSPKLLELEIPEKAVELAEVPAVLDRLSAIGVRLTIDDFGHELPLARLSELPISAIKIGPSLADLAGNDARGAALIRAAAHLSRDLCIDLSAMGVDEPNQLDFLQRVGCQRAQGDLYGPPQAADDTWLSAS